MRDPKPILRCLVAKSYYSPIELVPLEEAFDRAQNGWMVIGPDPEGEVDLANWERRNKYQLEVEDDMA
jgi:hypothetical protein